MPCTPSAVPNSWPAIFLRGSVGFAVPCPLHACPLCVLLFPGPHEQRHSEVYQLQMKLLEQFQNTRNTSLSISPQPRIHHNNDNKSRGFLSVLSIKQRAENVVSASLRYDAQEKKQTLKDPNITEVEGGSKACRSGSEVESTNCSCRGPGFHF